MGRGVPKRIVRRLLVPHFFGTSLADQFHAKPSEIRRFLSGQLDAERTRELADRVRAVGLTL